MGNDYTLMHDGGCSCHHHGGFVHSGWGWGINRSGWKPVSDRAKQALEEAKQEFHEIVKQYSFKNIKDENYKFTIKHAIKFHLVTKLRPQFNQYVAKFGAKSKWVKLSEEEKKSITKYKNRKSAIYFCNLIINKKVKDELFEKEPDLFKQELLITEISLFTYLVSVGIPEIDALGWIVPIPKSQKIEKIPKIKDLSQFLDEQQAKKPNIFIETTPEYQANPPKTKKVPTKTRIKRKRYDDINENTNNCSISQNLSPPKSPPKTPPKSARKSPRKSPRRTSSRKSPGRSPKKMVKKATKSSTNKSKKRKKRVSSDNEEWIPNQGPTKRRKLG